MHLLANSPPKEGQAELILKAAKGAVIMYVRAELWLSVDMLQVGRLERTFRSVKGSCDVMHFWSVTRAIKYTDRHRESNTRQYDFDLRIMYLGFIRWFLFLMGNLVTSI